MIQVETRYDPTAWARFNIVIDVRSPGEFAEDHLPNAVNLPVLSDAERAEVGTIYVQRSKFEARRIGAALVARNVASHLQGPAFATRPAADQVALYCWRGGQRSGAMAAVLDQVGWRTAVLQGGYATYRRQVSAALYGPALGLRLVLLAGRTGTAKTELLRRLGAEGVQTLDLEELAAHRGSLLGAWRGRAQPPQKLFESRLWAALLALDPTRPVVVEAESSKVGERLSPPALWAAMRAAPQVVVEAPVPARAAYLVEAYADLTVDAGRLRDLMTRLPVHHSQARRDAWLGLAAEGAWTALAEALMVEHYDPAYRRAARQAPGRTTLATIRLESLGPVDLASATGRIASAVETV